MAFVVVHALLLASASGGPAAASLGSKNGLDDLFDRVSQGMQQTAEQLEQLVQQLPWMGGGGLDSKGGLRQPEFAGTWRTAKTVDLDAFLDKSMGVGSLKRSIIARASQTQTLRLEKDNVVSLKVTDRRGTAEYLIRPDGKTYSGKGFMKLPIKQKAKWAKDGSLLVEERYFQHLGGEKHGERCSGDSCPVIFSRRSVDKASGQMLVEIERTLLDGEVMKTRTYYSAAAEK